MQWVGLTAFNNLEYRVKLRVSPLSSADFIVITHHRLRITPPRIRRCIRHNPTIPQHVHHNLRNSRTYASGDRNADTLGYKERGRRRPRLSTVNPARRLASRDSVVRAIYSAFRPRFDGRPR